MNSTMLKKFTVRSREQLMSAVGEKSAYIWLMRLCAAVLAEPMQLQEIMSSSTDERPRRFAELCEELERSLGGIFTLYGSCEPIPDILLADGGIAAELIELPSGIFSPDPETLGWVHQNFNSPVRDSAVSALKRRSKPDQDYIAASTQIFTPEWLVKYMIQNTLVRHWEESGGAPLPDSYHEYILGDITTKIGSIDPESITLIDPCAGCGNILLYAFDVFYEMYRACGYQDNIAADLILRKNLFGLELDKRACAVSETALRLKSRKIGTNSTPQVYCLSDIENLRTIGSLAGPESINRKCAVSDILANHYDIVVTNPPYLAAACMNAELSEYVKSSYAPFKADLFAVFMARCLKLTKPGGRLGFLTPYVWLFISSYEELRRLVYSKTTLESLVQLEYSAFEDATVPVCAFTMLKLYTSECGIFVRLTDFKGGLDVQEKRLLDAVCDPECGYRFTSSASDFARIPGAPAAYWVSPAVLRAFGGKTVCDIAPVRQGMITGDNDRFLRYWFEVEVGSIAFFHEIGKKWYLMNKGGDFRKWFGNREFVVNWENDGAEIRNFRDDSGQLRSRPQNLEFSFRPSVSWTLVTSSDISVRYYDENFMFNVAGSCAFPECESDLLFLLGLLNSSAAAELTRVLNPTMNLNVGDTARLPLASFGDDRIRMEQLVRENIELCKADWNSFETSFEFRRHPLL